MLKIFSLDPSGNGTTGMCLINQSSISFQQFQNKDWKAHYEAICQIIKTYQPDLLLYENTNYLHQRQHQGTVNLLKLIGAIESLPIKTENILVNQVKDLKKQLFKKTKQIKDLTFKPGIGWLYQQKKLSLHELDAYLVYWLWKENHA